MSNNKPNNIIPYAGFTPGGVESEPRSKHPDLLFALSFVYMMQDNGSTDVSVTYGSSFSTSRKLVSVSCPDAPSHRQREGILTFFPFNGYTATQNTRPNWPDIRFELRPRKTRIIELGEFVAVRAGMEKSAWKNIVDLPLDTSNHSEFCRTLTVLQIHPINRLLRYTPSFESAEDAHRAFTLRLIAFHCIQAYNRDAELPGSRTSSRDHQ